VFRFSAFQVVGAWANTGFSLVDQNLIPFQSAYPLLMFVVWLALAGNTGFVGRCLPDFEACCSTSSAACLVRMVYINRSIAEPILVDQSKTYNVGFLDFYSFSNQLTTRACRWINYKLTWKRSKWRETLHFLLDHPRRCFIYLFPSRQTWFLLTVLVILK